MTAKLRPETTTSMMKFSIYKVALDRQVLTLLAFKNEWQTLKHPKLSYAKRYIHTTMYTVVV